MQNNLPSINFIKDKQVPLVDKFLNWALTIGRLIIITTELVAVIAFVYRFSLDEQLVNLHSAIKQQKNIVGVLKNDENKYRNLQDRISLASTFSTTGTKTNQNITDIGNLVSSQAKINDLTINKDRVNINADVISVSALGTLIDSLKASQGIKSISIDNIENKPSAGLSVDITAILK